MKKFFIVMLFVHYQALAIQQVNLSFKPLDKIIYYSYYDYKTPAFPDKTKNTGSIKVAEMEESNKKSMLYDIRLSEIIRAATGPNRFRHSAPVISYNRYGVKEYWDHNHQREDLPGFSIEMIYRDYMLLLPFFNNKSIFQVGDLLVMTIKTPFIFGFKEKTAYEKNMPSKDDYYTTLAKLTQKIAAIETMLGYRCARIEYGIHGKCTNTNGEEMILDIKGTVHFAVDEGFVVSDIGEGFQDRMDRDGIIKRVYHKKKLRVLGYEPYQEGENE